MDLCGAAFNYRFGVAIGRSACIPIAPRHPEAWRAMGSTANRLGNLER
jgi:hypothetical protein